MDSLGAARLIAETASGRTALATSVVATCHLSIAQILQDVQMHIQTFVGCIFAHVSNN